MSSVRAAVIQAAPVVFDVRRSLAKLCDLTADACAFGVRLVVFPEGFVSGYPKGTSFGLGLGVRASEGREEYRTYYEGAVEVPGPGHEALAARLPPTASTWSSA